MKKIKKASLEAAAQILIAGALACAFGVACAIGCSFVYGVAKLGELVIGGEKGLIIGMFSAVPLGTFLGIFFTSLFERKDK